MSIFRPVKEKAGRAGNPISGSQPLFTEAGGKSADTPLKES